MSLAQGLPSAQPQSFTSRRGFIASSRSFRDLAAAELDQVETGIDELEANLTLHPGFLRIWMIAMLARLRIGVGQSERALLLDETLGKNERFGLHELDAELHRLRGEAILNHDSSATAEAEACFLKAIEVTKGQSAKWWEL